MRKALFGILTAVFLTTSLVSCSHQEMTTAEAQKKLDVDYEKRVGSATKNDLIQDFGSPEWCRMGDGGWETCRFYRKKGTTWTGTPTDRGHYDAYDQIVAQFDSSGILKSFKGSSQR